ncbi:MAG: PfkB family carbohydrate kinase [Candidatus Marsarchaeota archaeon]|nr:PfkB family carbohydrate kinase [Candidatus Marsarchaeota archaeon]
MGNANVDYSYRIRSFPRSDEVVVADGCVVSSGGSASNFAYAARRLGVNSMFVGAVGDDSAGKFFLDEMEAGGVDVSLVQVVKGELTGTVSIWVDDTGEKHGVAWRGANTRLTPVAGWRRLDEATVVHLAGCVPSVAAWLTDTLHTATTFDPGSSSGRFSAKQLGSMVSRCEVSFLSSREVDRAALEGVSLIDDARFSRKILVIKMGGKGVEVHFHGGALKMEPLPSEVVDTTGAGDAFASAFVFRYLRDKDVAEATRWGTASAALKVRRLGSKSGVPTLDELQRFVELNRNRLKPVEA